MLQFVVSVEELPFLKITVVTLGSKRATTTNEPMCIMYSETVSVGH